MQSVCTYFIYLYNPVILFVCVCVGGCVRVCGGDDVTGLVQNCLSVPKDNWRIIHLWSYTSKFLLIFKRCNFNSSTEQLNAYSTIFFKNTWDFQSIQVHFGIANICSTAMSYNEDVKVMCMCRYHRFVRGRPATVQRQDLHIFCKFSPRQAECRTV